MKRDSVWPTSWRKSHLLYTSISPSLSPSPSIQSALFLLRYFIALLWETTRHRPLIHHSKSPYHRANTFHLGAPKDLKGPLCAGRIGIWLVVTWSELSLCPNDSFATIKGNIVFQIASLLNDHFLCSFAQKFLVKIQYDDKVIKWRLLWFRNDSSFSHTNTSC